MACVTLKRPLEWVDPSMSPESGSSSPTHMIISNSPPHHGLRSPKRLCLQPISQNSAFTNAPISCQSSSLYNSNVSANLNNPNNFKSISSSEIADQIREEMYRLRILKRNHNATNASNCGSMKLKSNDSQQQRPLSLSSASQTDKGSLMESSSINSSPSSSPTHQDEGLSLIH